MPGHFRFYNTERPHQALEYQTPAEVFISNNHVVTQGNDVQSGNPLTSLEALEAAGPALNMGLIGSTSEQLFSLSRYAAQASAWQHGPFHLSALRA